jgi:hypothetical protein
MRLQLIAAIGFFLCAAVGAKAQLTDAQIDAAFAKADTDKSGTVGLSEARKFNITVDMFRKADVSKHAALDRKGFADAIRYQFAWANGNHGDTLDWKEASKAGVKSKKIFDAVDSDHDGTLDLAEYVVALTLQAK